MAIQAQSSKGILVLLEPDENVRDALLTLLRGRGWMLETANEISSLRELLRERDVAAVISEARLPDCPASDILKTCAQPKVPVIFTGYDLPAQEAVDLIHQGGYDYLEKPFKLKRMLQLLDQLANREAVQQPEMNH